MKESNFKKAVNEILSFDFSGDNQSSKKDDEIRRNMTEQKSAVRKENKEPFPEEVLIKPEGEKAVNARDTGPSAFTAQENAVSAAAAARPEAIITADMIIDGNVRTQSNMRVSGQITGEVKCEGSLILSGKITGDVFAESMRVQSGKVTGNIQTNEELSVDNNSWIKGDISAGRLVFNGHEEGNIMVKESIELRESAKILGNISSKCVSMYNGAQVKGMIDIGGIEEIKEE